MSPGGPVRRETVAVEPTETADRELVRLFEEQAALRRVATLVARGADRLAVCATVTRR
jgi:hypothetical protein